MPTLSDLYTSVLGDLQTEFNSPIGVGRRVMLRAIAAVQAGKLKLLYLALAMVQKNIFPDTADPESAGGTLERFGRTKLGRNPYPAVQGQYIILIAGTAGAVVPAGTRFVADPGADNPGALYITDSNQTLFSSSVPAGPFSIGVRALTAGSSGALAPGDTLTAAAPLVGAASTATTIDESVAAVDAETTEEYRAKVLQAFRTYPQGGSAADYRLWAQNVAGVRAIYPYAASGAPSEVNVFVEATSSASTDGMGTPGSSTLSSVTSQIEVEPVTGRGRRPLTVRVNVLPVIINKLDVTITGSSAIPAAGRVVITAALRAAVDAVRPFIAGADVTSARNDAFGVNNIALTILSALPGTIYTGATMTVTIGTGSPVATASKTFDVGNIPYLNSVTFS